MGRGEHEKAGRGLGLVAGGFVLTLASLFLLAGKAHAALYWGQLGGIARANLDGSLYQPDFVKAGVCAIAVDSSHVYWSDNSAGTIGRAGIDGAGADHSFIPLESGSNPCSLAVDSQFIYWANKGGEGIGRARLDGSQVEPSFIPAIPLPCSLAIDETSIYWGSEIGQIRRTDIGGKNSPELVAEVTDPCGLALHSSHLFWTDRDADMIGRVNLDGSDPEPGFIGGASGPNSPVIEGGHLYWVNAGGASIGRADLSGQNVNQTFIGRLHWPWGLAADATQLVPPPPAPPAMTTSLELGKLHRRPNGSVLFPLNLLGQGLLEVDIPGVKVSVRTDLQGGWIDGPHRSWAVAGFRWLKIAPTTKRGVGNGCVLRAYRSGLQVKLQLRLRFTEHGKQTAFARRPFKLFKPAAVKQRIRSKGKSATVNCLPR